MLEKEAQNHERQFASLDARDELNGLSHANMDGL